MFRRLIPTLLLFVALPALAQEPKSPTLTPEEQKLAGEAGKLNREGVQLYQRGNPAEAVEKMQQALEIYRKLYPASKYPDGHHYFATILNNLGRVFQAMNQAEKAVTFIQQSLEMRLKLYPAATHPYGHPDLASSLNNLGSVLQAMGKAEKAATFIQQSLDMHRKLYPVAKYPDGHPDLARCLNNLGVVLATNGQTEKAATILQQSLDMRLKLYPVAKYPDGHPDLAQSLNNLGTALKDMGQAEKASTIYQQSLDMTRRLFPAAKYPDGHPELALSLYNLGSVLLAIGQAEKATTFYQQSLDMTRRLFPAAKYPDGHPDLATSLSNMGFVLQSEGQVDKAATFYQQSLDMKRKLYPAAKYPDGHPDLTVTLINMGSVLQAMGHADKAATFYQQSLEMQQRLLQRELLTASELAAFDRVAAEPLARDSYLSATRSLNLAARDCYEAIAPSRSVVTRVLEQRLASARVAGTAVAEQIDQLKGNRRQTDRLLQDFGMNKDQRDKLLVKYADERDKLERTLLMAMPWLKRGRELDQLGPDALTQTLPAHTVFIDLIAYTRFEFEKGKQKRIPSYVVFVLAKDRPIQRIDLGDANDINAAIHAWRSAIAVREPSAEAGRLARLVWEPIAKRLPLGTKTLYLAPDGDLSRLPWAALPVSKDRVLLEDYAIAQMPHGMFLLDQLKFPRSFTGLDSLLALGGIDYGSGIWPALPGTATEVEALTKLAPGATRLTKADATIAKVKALLPTVRYAHLATHGEFQSDALTAERKRAVAALAARQLGDDSRRVAAKNPLGYVGLVLANSEIFSGLSIVDLPLGNLQLVTLSACETGLGEYTGGEGVQGLQRAFHLAGCPNVIASLWKVNDAATAALMAKFYHELRVNKKPPIDALREAQLMIYRHPESIPDLAGERGAPKLKDAVAVNASAKPQAARRADTKLWAAFVLSGVGQ